MPHSIRTPLLALLLIATALPASAWDRPGPSGSAETRVGPQGGVTAAGTRNVEGNKANSEFSVTGQGGQGVTGNAASTVKGNKASGEAHVETTQGRSADLKGEVQKKGDTVSGSGSVVTGMGRSVSGQGSATKTDSGYQASGTATTGQGKEAEVTASGTKETGTVSVSTDRGSKSRNYDRAAPQGPKP